MTKAVVSSPCGGQPDEGQNEQQQQQPANRSSDNAEIARCLTHFSHPGCSVKATFHLTISMRGKRATVKIQRNNYHHGSCGPSFTGKTMSVFLIFTQGTHRNVKNR